MRNLKLRYPGGCVFYDKLTMSYAQNVNDLVDGTFVGCCIAAQNLRKFARV